MNILYVLIPLGLGVLVLAIAAFFWAVRTGQYDDLEAHGRLVLFDEERGSAARPKEEPNP